MIIGTRLHGAGGLEPQTATADDGADERAVEFGGASLHEIAHRFHRVERPIDEASGQPEPLDGEPSCERSVWPPR